MSHITMSSTRGGMQVALEMPETENIMLHENITVNHALKSFLLNTRYMR